MQVYVFFANNSWYLSFLTNSNLHRMLKSLLSYCDTKLIRIAIFGFISGMNLLLSGNTLNFWLASYDIDTTIVGIFSIVALPYAFKYFIALFIGSDKMNLFSNKMSNYKTWLCISQIMLTLSLVFISLLNPKIDLIAIAICGILIATFSVITDIILNAGRISLVTKEIQPLATSMFTLGYRLGMVFSGAGVIYLSTMISWQEIFLIIAIIQFFLGLFIYITFIESDSYNDNFQIQNYQYNLEENSDRKTTNSFKLTEELSANLENNQSSKITSLFHNIIIRPFEHFLSFRTFLWIIIFIFFFRFSDNMLSAMNNSFLLKTGFTVAEIATISKFFGTLMVIIGGLISGALVTKLGIRFSLISFSVIHLFGHFLYIFMVNIGKNTLLLYLLTGYEALTGGMMMVAYISFISGFCSGKYIGIQYALLSSGMGLSRSLFPIFSGIIVDNFGWGEFFYFVIILSLLTIIFLFFIPKSIFNLYYKKSEEKNYRNL